MTDSELKVMEMVFNNIPTDQIAERLFLSIHTVNNHRRNALQRLKLHSIQEFISYAHKNKLFEK
ncbi:MAG: helix-turn-helix transcriptional regulator [Dysgonomonas sp.]